MHTVHINRFANMSTHTSHHLYNTEGLVDSGSNIPVFCEGKEAILATPQKMGPVDTTRAPPAVERKSKFAQRMSQASPPVLHYDDASVESTAPPEKN